MTIKYKLAFTIDSETLFGIMSKFLPIQDLSVEEVVVPTPDPAIRFDKRFDQLPKPKRAKQVRRGGGTAFNLTRGVNAVVVAVLADHGKHSPLEIKQALAKTTYSPAGLGSKLSRLLDLGFIQNHKGMYSLTLKGIEASKPREEAYVESI